MKTTLISIIAAGALTAHAFAETLSIKGSNTFGEELGPRLISAFTRTRPDWRIDLEARHSGFGILALLDGECDIAASSRPINEDEARLARSRGIKLRTHTIGYYGIAVIVHPDNPVKNLADHQVRDIFTGAIDNWQAIGGRSSPIAVHIIGESAGTHFGFQELALERRPYSETAIRHGTYSDIGKAVAADPRAIGFIALPFAAGLPVRAVSINGIAPTPFAVSDNLYPFARMLRFYTNAKTESKAASEFIRFVRSTAGQNVIEEAGFVRRFQRRFSLGMETL